MVAISSQYLSGADKAVQIRQSVFVDKRTQSKPQHSKREIAFLIRISDLLYPCSFVLKLSGNSNVALHSIHTQPDLCVLKL